MSSTHWHVQCCDWHDHGRSAFPCAHAKPVHASYLMADATVTFILFSNSRASSTLAPAPIHPVLGLSTGIAHYTPHAVARVASASTGSSSSDTRSTCTRAHTHAHAPTVHDRAHAGDTDPAPGTFLPDIPSSLPGYDQHPLATTPAGTARARGG